MKFPLSPHVIKGVPSLSSAMRGAVKGWEDDFTTIESDQIIVFCAEIGAL
jgi:hypothetical protein